MFVIKQNVEQVLYHLLLPNPCYKHTKPMRTLLLAMLIITAYQACIVELQLSVLHQTGPEPDSQILEKGYFLKQYINKVEYFFYFRNY